MPTIAIMSLSTTKILISPGLGPLFVQTPSTNELPFKDFLNFTPYVLESKAPKVPLNKQMSASSQLGV